MDEKGFEGLQKRIKDQKKKVVAIRKIIQDKPFDIFAFGKLYHTFGHVGQYRDGGEVLVEFLMEDGTPFSTLTVNIPEVVLGEREILVKVWSENADVSKAVLAYPMFRDTGARIHTGFVHAQIWEVLTPKKKKKYTVHLMMPYTTWQNIEADSKKEAISKCEFPRECDIQDIHSWAAVKEGR